MALASIDVRDLPGTREEVIARDGGLFPVVVAAGDRLIAVVRGGAGHLGRAGRLELLSADIGSPWTPPTIIAEGERDCRNAALGCADSGALVLAYQRQGSYDERGVYRPGMRDAGGARPIDVVVSLSVDGGVTWSSPAPLGVDELACSSPYGKIVTLGGELLLPLYDPFAAGGGASHVVRSVDDGRTWSRPSLVAVGCNETALVATGDDELLAVLRTADRDQRLVAARSHDRGETWSSPEPVTGPGQHPGDLVRLSTGALVLTYGNRAGPYRIEGRISRDRGRSWSEPIAFSGDLYGADAGPGRMTDLGYPSSAVAGGRAVTVYYVNPDLAPRADGLPTHLQPPYPATGYRAVAVSWREDALLAALAG